MHHLGASGSQKDKDEQQISIEPCIQRCSTDVGPLIPKYPPIPVEEEIGKSADKEGREWAGTEISVKYRGRREEDCCVPKVKARAGEFPV